MDIKPVYKKLSLSDFAPDEVIIDRVGTVFIKREAVAELLETSFQTLNTEFRKKGLLPLDRYIKGYKPYMLEDVEQAYNKREK